MRTIQTFVLRLLTDPDEPLALRGVIQAVASGEEQPFADGAALLALLRHLAGQDLTDSHDPCNAEIDPKKETSPA